MKIIVMDSANVRIEFFDVADNMLNDDIEKFLAEHNISLNSVSWMAAPIDYFSVILHDISIDKKSGEEVHSLRPAKLKNFSVYDSVQEVKHREQVELTNALRLHGKQVNDGMNGTFKENALLWQLTTMMSHVTWLSFLSE